MAGQKNNRDDERLERLIGGVLRAGVIAAALVVAVGGILYLREHAFALPDYHAFDPAAAYARSLSGIVQNALHFSSYGIIQLGLLLLIATPVMRVAFSVVAFALQKDLTYVMITFIVLAVLMCSMLGHGPG